MTELTAKLASSSTVEMTQLVMPTDASALGTAFGGRVLQWIDLAAAMAAMRHCRTPAVTAAIDRVAFLAPIHVGDVVVLRAQINAVFGSSMEIQVDVEAEQPRSGERRRCCEAFVTFVALGDSGRPARAPILLPQTEEEERRAREATQRRAARLARRGRS